MRDINVVHAVLFSEDGEDVFFEKNERYNGKLTLFGGKIEIGESKIAAIIRELREEIGIIFSENDFIEIISGDELIVGDTRFIGTIYFLLITKYKVDIVLSNPKNISFPFNNLPEDDFQFPDTIGKVKIAHEKIFN